MERSGAIRLKRFHSVDEGNVESVRIKIADSMEELINTFSLVHDTYVRLGYMDPHPSGMRISIHNALPTTKVFIGRSKGAFCTATLIFDSQLGLPSDVIYKEELDCLRKEGRKITEGSSLVNLGDIRERNLMALFKVLYIYVKYAGSHDICITVNPKHAWFYEKVLLFERIGGLKYHLNVKDAPAILERIDLRTAKEKFLRTYGNHDLYSFFFSNGQINPADNGFYMSGKMLRYFFIEETDILAQVSRDAMDYIKSYYPDYNFKDVHTR